MDKFVFISDLHFRNNNVKTRRDNFFKAILKKLKWVLKWCDEHGVENVIIGGDIFHSPNISDYLAYKIAKTMCKSNQQFYCILGNHDLVGKNPKSYIYGKVGLFMFYKNIHMIGGRVVDFKHTSLSGIDFTYENEDSNEFSMPRNHDYGGKVRMLVVHSMIADTENDMIMGGKRVLMGYAGISTNADVLLCGHYHIGIGVKKIKVLENTTYISNPGSIARTDKATDRAGIGPAMNYITVDDGKKINIKHIKIPHRDVFIHEEDDKVYAVDDKARGRFLYLLEDFKHKGISSADIGMVLRAFSKDEASKCSFEIDDDLINMITDRIKKLESAQ